MIRAWLRECLPSWIAVSLFAVTLVRLGMGLGYANNGDFWRAMAPSGIVYRPGLTDKQIFFHDRQSLYQLAPLPPNAAALTYSLGDLVVRAAMVVQKALAPEAAARGAFHLFPVSALLAAIAFGLVYLIWPALSTGRRWLAVALLWVAADPYYSLFLGSMYAEGLSVVSFAALALALLAGGRRGAVLAAVTLFLFTFSKTQFILTPLLLAIASFAVVRRRPGLPLIAAAVAFAAAALFYFTRSPQGDLRMAANFHSVFYGVAMTSPAPPAMLASLGFRPEAGKLVGRSSFDPATRPYEYPGLETELLAFSRWHALLLHLREPSAVGEVLRRAGDAFHSRRINYLGQYEEPYGLPDTGVCSHLDYCAPRAMLGVRGRFVYWAVVLAASALILFTASHAGLRLFWLFFTLFATTHVYIVFLGAGFWEFEKHLVLARLSFDFLFITGCGVLTMPAAAAISRRFAAPSRIPGSTGSR